MLFNSCGNIILPIHATIIDNIKHLLQQYKSRFKQIFVPL